MKTEEDSYIIRQFDDTYTFCIKYEDGLELRGPYETLDLAEKIFKEAFKILNGYEYTDPTSVYEWKTERKLIKIR